MELTATKYKHTELGLIPEDWSIHPLKEYLSENPKYGIGAAAVDFNSKHPTYLRITDIDEAGNLIKEGLKSVDHLDSSNYILEEGEIVFARTGASVGKSYLFNKKDGELVYAGFLIKIKPDPKKLSAEYLSKYVTTGKYWHWVIVNSMRSGQPGINSQEYGLLPIPVPPTLTEQKAIAQVLSDTDALIQALEKKIAKKKNIKKGIMQKLLTPKANWKVSKIKDLASYRRGSFPQPYGLPQWYNSISGMPFIQVVDVGKNFKLKSETKQKISSLGAEMSVFVKKGTIILTLQGSIGRICITDYDAYVDRTLLIFESFKEDFNKYFFMLSIWLKFQIEKENAPGGIIKTITKEALSSFEIPYPQKEEQDIIAQTLSDMDNEIEYLEQVLYKYQLTKQGMMQKLLTGKIRLV